MASAWLEVVPVPIAWLAVPSGFHYSSTAPRSALLEEHITHRFPSPGATLIRQSDAPPLLNDAPALQTLRIAPRGHGLEVAEPSIAVGLAAVIAKRDTGTLTRANEPAAQFSRQWPRESAQGS